ncbi:MAG: flavodoxin [Spirochaetes bacterium]|jgi:cellobiose-specific phosphotransferase system component IIB|nr:flavodoxin [Spirochaetota bacterium]
MKTGIIVYSYTGNTLSVAEKLKEAIEKKGHDCTIEKIAVNEDYDPNNDMGKFTILESPDPTKYDFLVLAGSVIAFSLSPVMKRYCKTVKAIEDKKIALLVTQHLPFAWMGGNRALRRMEKMCTFKKAVICAKEVINWSRKDREERITSATNRIASLV